MISSYKVVDFTESEGDKIGDVKNLQCDSCSWLSSCHCGGNYVFGEDFDLVGEMRKKNLNNGLFMS